jgi:hypothetical protein
MQITDIHHANASDSFRIILDPNQDHRTICLYLLSRHSIQIELDRLFCQKLLDGQSSAQDEIVFRLLPDFSADEFTRAIGDRVKTIYSFVRHGSYFSSSTFVVHQHKYASTDCEEAKQMFLEILEIVNPPDGNQPFVLHQYKGNSIYFEFPTLKEATTSFEQVLTNGWAILNEDLANSKRQTSEQNLPWFYAHPSPK